MLEEHIKWKLDRKIIFTEFEFVLSSFEYCHYFLVIGTSQIGWFLDPKDSQIFGLLFHENIYSTGLKND